ncbi:Fruiting body protein SC14 [Rhizoctonia solani]|uniref:Fruiting body protein SC14 n=1 Tax=Rhizoctonia solani TaxID=456999 RepID=A0A0K6FUI0_9AGAM|nr:Fruiting body protein SC14 [Rhizoctonia solani]
MLHFTVTFLALVVAGSASAQRQEEARTINVTNTHFLATRAIRKNYLTTHNNERVKHGAKALTWDNALASSAQAWANQCKFQHSRSGENLYAGTGNPTAAAAVGAWNAESKDYNPRNSQPSHWTQVIWKGTTKLGCALKQCAPGTILDAKYVANYYVCHYSPVGNVIGQFPQNVRK